MTGVYIPSIDAKDLQGAGICNGAVGYPLKTKEGGYNKHKFINTLDYSLDLIKLREIYHKKYRRHDFSFKIGRGNNKEYTQRVINVTFKQSYKDWNMAGSPAWGEAGGYKYIKAGYDDRGWVYKDGAYVVDGELRGIQLNYPVESGAALSQDVLGKYFKYDEDKKCYVIERQPSTLFSRKQLRQKLYEDGFVCNGIRFVRWKRSAGSARVGKCLFIDENLQSAFHKWDLCGLKVEDGQEIDLAALESYIALTASSIIDTIEIEPKNILVVDDWVSEFEDNVAVTFEDGGHLKTEERRVTIKNTIWDGESLMDVSMFGAKYEDKGMLLLRNRFFKSCCFNANIQEWFKDHGVESVDQLRGFTLAENIADIKLITTPSSIKYVKFGSIEQWLANLNSTFGIVKYEKPTHFFDGKLVQAHYQLINTLELSEGEVEEFLAPSFDQAQKLRWEPAYVRHQVKITEDSDYDGRALPTRNDLIYECLGINDEFPRTKQQHEFVNDLMKAFYKNLKKGHVLVHGNYSTLCGNPIELLQYVIGEFDGESVVGRGNVVSLRFEDGEDLLGSRSPHCCFGNVLVVKNVRNELVTKYMNLSDEIVIINSIGENILSQLSGAD